MVWDPGTKLHQGRYTITRVLGQGGFGITYLADDPDLKPVVIKTLKDEVLQKTNFEDLRGRFQQEALQLALCRHPNIVEIETFFSEGPFHCIVMEHVQGRDLGHWVRHKGIFPEELALKCIQEVGSALEVVHKKGLLHRDIKPENILICERRAQAVLIDFGIARQLFDGTRSNTGFLTPTYAPPEQYSIKARLGPYTDVYALAATLYYLLTGETPETAPLRALGNELVNPQELNAKISDQVRDAILKGMELRWQDRPSGVQEWLHLLPTVSEFEANDFEWDRFNSSNAQESSTTVHQSALLSTVLKEGEESTDFYTHESQKPLTNAPNLTQVDKSFQRKINSDDQKDRTQIDKSFQEKIDPRTRLQPTRIDRYFQRKISMPQTTSRPLFNRDTALGTSLQKKQEDKPKITPSRPVFNRDNYLGGKRYLPQKTNIFEFEVVTVDQTGKEISRQTKEAEFYQIDLGSGVTLEMVRIPAGSFIMGSHPFEEWQEKDEIFQHEVTFDHSFWAGKYPITQAQWNSVVLATEKIDIDLRVDPSTFKGDTLPVEQVSWCEAVEFCKRLSQISGRDYRLPTEAEWEYACRAGTTTAFHFGETITPHLANYDGRLSYGAGPRGVWRQQTTPVGFFKVANGFGLYDMHGNVYEWCMDPWHETYEGAPEDNRIWEGDPHDGQVWEGDLNHNYRVLRGGSWFFHPCFARSANRFRLREDDYRSYTVGFRVFSSGKKEPLDVASLPIRSARSARSTPDWPSRI
jgi:formylglycine-generating enzyme required for sulfatase activity/predicted Ser/Thr protein kinase